MPPFPNFVLRIMSTVGVCVKCVWQKRFGKGSQGFLMSPVSRVKNGGNSQSPTNTHTHTHTTTTTTRTPLVTKNNSFSLVGGEPNQRKALPPRKGQRPVPFVPAVEFQGSIPHVERITLHTQLTPAIVIPQPDDQRFGTLTQSPSAIDVRSEFGVCVDGTMGGWLPLSLSLSWLIWCC